MHWRFVDRVDSFVPWKAIAGTKVVSFEEISLLKPFGRKGDFPEGLVLECCVELVRWLVAASSGFEQASVLEEIEEFRLSRVAGPGVVLKIAVEVEQRDEEMVLASCRASLAGTDCASGRIECSLVSLRDGFDPELVAGMWRELYGAA